MKHVTMLFLMFYCLFAATPLFAQSASDVLQPAEFFGFEPGSDRNLFTYEQLIEYLERIDGQSGRITMAETGKSPMGRPVYICFISSGENIADLDALRDINRALALNPDIQEERLRQYIEQGRVFVLSTLSMHSGEVGPSQAAPKIAYRLAVTEDPDTLGWLQNTVLMLIPCHNPDGMNMVVEHYLKYKGTPEEGASMPGIYHKYVGHDNNRDFVTLSQTDTKAIARIYNLEWFPQVMVEKHQMGSTGPRYFVPPPHDPIAENIDARIWNWIGLFGANMQKDMTADGLEGISQHYLFDDYWPGSTETCIWKNVIGFLTEAASVHYATPIFIEPTELKVYGKGLSEYKKSINMPLPWEGGWWHLSDIIDLEFSSTMSILKTSSVNHDKILRFRNEICRSEIQKGKSEAPYYYMLPREQHDQSEFTVLIELLFEHGLKVFKLTDEIKLDHRVYRKGDIVVPLAQPFRSFAKEVLEKQRFPVRHYTPDGEMIKPYDITSWSLPLHRGVHSVEINKKLIIPEDVLEELTSAPQDEIRLPENAETIIFSANNNESYRAAFAAHRSGLSVKRTNKRLSFDESTYPAGSFVVGVEEDKKQSIRELLHTMRVQPAFDDKEKMTEAVSIRFPKIGLVESYFHDMDAGWTRFVFDSYDIPYRVLRPHELAEKKIFSSLDVLVFPDEAKSVLVEGKWKSGDAYYVSSYPKEYTKGMGKHGLENLTSFIVNGGHIISWGHSTELFTGTLSLKVSEKESEEIQLPVNDIAG
jgi:hypothetical protein